MRKHVSDEGRGHIDNTANSCLRLTEKGCRQAEFIGEILRDMQMPVPSVCYLSEFVRAQETAAHLLKMSLPNADVLPFPLRYDARIVERHWGLHDQAPQISNDLRELEERRKSLEQQDPYFTPKFNGESLADVEVRVKSFFGTLWREFSNQDVLTVAHGEVIEVVTKLVLRWPALDFKNMPYRDPRNCAAYWFSRRHEDSRTFDSLRVITPDVDTNEFDDTGWMSIKRRKMTSVSDLFEYVNRFPYVLSHK